MDGADAVPQSAPQLESHEAPQPAAATAASAGPERYFPPDFSVSLFFDAALPASDQPVVAARVARQLAQWQAQDEAGSADGAWAVSVLLGQQGQLRESAAARHRADERGSADAPYRLACDLMATDPKAAEEALLAPTRAARREPPKCWPTSPRAAASWGRNAPTANGPLSEPSPLTPPLRRRGLPSRLDLRQGQRPRGGRGRLCSRRRTRVLARCRRARQTAGQPGRTGPSRASSRTRHPARRSRGRLPARPAAGHAR